jgi:hypothetical protein
MAQGQQQEQQLLRIDSSGRNEADAPDDFVVVGQIFSFSNVPSRRRHHSRRPGAKKMGPPKSQSTITGQEDKRFSNGPARALLFTLHMQVMQGMNSSTIFTTTVWPSLVQF